jgi:hypothetical protein
MPRPKGTGVSAGGLSDHLVHFLDRDWFLSRAIQHAIKDRKVYPRAAKQGLIALEGKFDAITRLEPKNFPDWLRNRRLAPSRKRRDWH